jgi:hypothetical protein
MGKTGTALATALIALACCSGTAAAAALPDQTMQSPTQVLTWHGASPDQTGQGYGPPTEQTCTPMTCDSFLIHVNLPAGTFPKGAQHPAPAGITRVNAEGPSDMPGDGILISIKWATDFDQWNLYVDDMSTGQTVAQGIDVDSNAQSVLLSQPHNGTYRVTMVPFYTDFDKADLSYQGEARVFQDPTQRYARTTQLLPKIHTMPPSNFHIADVPPIPSNPTGWRFTPNGTFANSCYADETTQFGSTRCLRFDNNIRNVGDGPLVLRFDYTPDAFAGNCNMQQEILSTNATVTDRGAGPCVFHAQHAHFHYQNMGQYRLYAVDSKGSPGGQPVAASNKVGFCTIDVDDYGFGSPPDLQRPRTYSFPTCNIPNAYTTQLPTSSPYGPGGVPEYMGISPGWGDVYTWDLPQQYIDISKNVPDGVYEVVSRSNFDGQLLTADRSEETGITCVRITGTTVKTLQEMPSQPDSAALPSCAHGLGLASVELPASARCVDTRRFTFRLHHGPRSRVVRVAVFVNGKRRRLVTGHSISRVTIGRLPRKRFVVRIVATQSRGSKLTSTRTYNGCRKSRPHTRGHHHR